MPIELINSIVNPSKSVIGNQILERELTLYGSILLYRIWEKRNKALHGENKISPLDFTNKLIEEYNEHTKRWICIENKQTGKNSPFLKELH